MRGELNQINERLGSLEGRDGYARNTDECDGNTT